MDRKDIDLTDVGIITMAIAWIGRSFQTWLRTRATNKEKAPEVTATNGGRVISDMAAAQTRGFEVTSAVLKELLDKQSREHATERDELRKQIEELETEVGRLREENADLKLRLSRLETIQGMRNQQ